MRDTFLLFFNLLVAVEGVLHPACEDAEYVSQLPNAALQPLADGRCPILHFALASADQLPPPLAPSESSLSQLLNKTFGSVLPPLLMPEIARRLLVHLTVGTRAL